MKIQTGKPDFDRFNSKNLLNSNSQDINLTHITDFDSKNHIHHSIINIISS